MYRKLCLKIGRWLSNNILCEKCKPSKSVFFLSKAILECEHIHISVCCAHFLRDDGLPICVCCWAVYEIAVERFGIWAVPNPCYTRSSFCLLLTLTFFRFFLHTMRFLPCTEKRQKVWNLTQGSKWCVMSRRVYFLWETVINARLYIVNLDQIKFWLPVTCKHSISAKWTK